MTFWLVAIPVVVAVAALVWWSSGRAKPDLRRRSIEVERGIAEGRAGMYDTSGGGFDAGPGGF